MQGTATFRRAFARAKESAEGRHRDQRGASVLEWAMIAAVVVLAASVIGAAIFRIVDKKTEDLETCANKPAGSAECERGSGG